MALININTQLRLDVQRFLWPVNYILYLYYAGPLNPASWGVIIVCHSGRATICNFP